MAKRTASFICQACGAVYTRWQGKCESCGDWNTLVEEIEGGAPALRVGRGRAIELEGLAGDARPAARIVTGVEEFDRVTGGGFEIGRAHV